MPRGWHFQLRLCGRSDNSPENIMKLGACKTAGKPGCRPAHTMHFSLLLLTFSSVAILIFALSAHTYPEASPEFGVTVKMASGISQYSHRESHPLHQARLLSLKPQESSPSASLSIKVYVMPEICTRLRNEHFFLCTLSICTLISGSLCTL